MTLELRCYAYRDGQGWEAICVDLDLATFADSRDEVQESLAACIEMYLERVAELPVDEQSRFLVRKSPWHLRAKLALMTWFSGLRGSADGSWGFTFESQLPKFS